MCFGQRPAPTSVVKENTNRAEDESVQCWRSDLLRVQQAFVLSLLSLPSRHVHLSAHRRRRNTTETQETQFMYRLLAACLSSAPPPSADSGTGGLNVHEKIGLRLKATSHHGTLHSTQSHSQRRQLGLKVGGGQILPACFA